MWELAWSHGLVRASAEAFTKVEGKGRGKLLGAPVLKRDTVTTAESVGLVSRLTSDWRATTARAPAITGSAVSWGMAPCPPRPAMMHVKLSVAAMMVPACAAGPTSCTFKVLLGVLGGE